MEAMLLSSTPDQSISPYKHNRNPRKINTTHAFISRPSENSAPPSYIRNKVHGGGLIGPPPSLYSSLPSSVLVLNQQQQQPHPPPLLLLPISKPYSSLPTRNRKGGGISTISSPNNKKTTNSKTRGLEVTPKKSKSSNSSKQEEKRSEAKFERSLMTVSTNPSGPDPCDLPKKVSSVLKSKVLFRSVINNKGAAAAAADDDDTNTTAVYGGGVVEELACSIYSLAPPPSSLPLPKFSLKPKLGCNVKAGVLGVDAGATDSLRRLLRLR